MIQRQSLRISLSERRPATLPKQLLAMLVASLSAVTANVILYFVLKDIVGIEFIAPEQFPPTEVSPLLVTDVVIFSLVFSAGASIVFLIVANTSRRPAFIFVVISIVVLLISFLLPLKIPTPPVPMATKLSLVSMHILGAAVLVPLLIDIGLPKDTRKSLS
jgi:hypothetical protein